MGENPFKESRIFVLTYYLGNSSSQLAKLFLATINKKATLHCLTLA